jgi:hypothetical protein
VARQLESRRTQVESRLVARSAQPRKGIGVQALLRMGCGFVEADAFGAQQFADVARGLPSPSENRGRRGLRRSGLDAC